MYGFVMQPTQDRRHMEVYVPSYDTCIYVPRKLILPVKNPPSDIFSWSNIPAGTAWGHAAEAAAMASFVAAAPASPGTASADGSAMMTPSSSPAAARYFTPSNQSPGNPPVREYKALTLFFLL